MEFKWEENERVLCYHGPLIYEAKILKVDHKNDDPSQAKEVPDYQYWVHYKGWKQSWDEWVPPARLLKLTDASFAKQKQLVDSARAARDIERAMVEAAQAASAAASATPPPPPPPPPQPAYTGGYTGPSTTRSSVAGPFTLPQAAAPAPARNKPREEMISGSSYLPRKRAREGDSEGDYLRRPEIKIPIPDVLKVQLVDDWEAVTKNHQIVILPRAPTVADLILEYKAYAMDRIANPPPPSIPRANSTSSRPPKEPIAPNKAVAILTEVLSGLQLYFDRALGANLLYRFERSQYVEQRRRHQEAAGGSGAGEDFEASKIYGAEHLLRLFVNLPSFIAHTSMDSESVKLLREHMVDFMKYMVKEQKRIFLPEYELATTTYINQARV